MTYDYNRERQEAIDAGNKALQSLYAAQNDLNSAKNWGIVDLLGGGMITSLIKHSKMNNAQSHMEQAKYDLQKFSKELADVAAYISLDFNAADFLSFAITFLTVWWRTGSYRAGSIMPERRWMRRYGE